MTALRTQFDPGQIDRIARDLDRSGFVCLHGAIDPAWLDRARTGVQAMLDEYGERYFSIVRPADEAGSPAAELVGDPGIGGLLGALALHARPSGADLGEEVYNVLRVVAGPEGEAGSLKFHYDASVVTALVPIFIPQGEPGTSGELVIFPNRRGYGDTVFTNIVRKALVQSPTYQRRIARRLPNGSSGRICLLEPGNLYLFWGYRTYHGNYGVAANRLRATMLLHYGDPHGRSPVTRAVRNLRAAREARRIGSARA